MCITWYKTSIFSQNSVTLVNHSAAERESEFEFSVVELIYIKSDSIPGREILVGTGNGKCYMKKCESLGLWSTDVLIVIWFSIVLLGLKDCIGFKY